MAKLTPFRALRPTPQGAPLVSSVPYDVVNTAEARTLAAGNPLSFLHVTRSEIDLPAETDPHSDAVYALARRNLDALRSDRYHRRRILSLSTGGRALPHDGKAPRPDRDQLQLVLRQQTLCALLQAAGSGIAADREVVRDQGRTVDDVEPRATQPLQGFTQRTTGILGR